MSIDSIGPLPKSKKGNTHIIVAIDHFTKWVEAEAIPSNNADNTARFISTNIIYRHGSPQTILTDNGKNYIAKGVTKLYESLAIHGLLTAPYHPQTNGMVERVNGTLMKILRCYAEESDEWDEYLPAALMAYQTARHSATGFSPFRMMYGREPALPSLLLPTTLDLKDFNYDKYLREFTAELVAVQASGWEKITSGHQLLLKDKIDDTNDYPKYDLQDKVLSYVCRKLKDRPTKLESVWDGPYTVIHRRNNEYAICHDLNGQVINRVHARFLRPYYHPRQKSGVTANPIVTDTITTGRLIAFSLLMVPP